MSGKTHRWSLTAVCAALGAVSGVGLVWFMRTQPRPPGSSVLDNGLRSPMPVVVIGPPVWVYLVAGVVGALVVSGIALAATHVRRRTKTNTV